MTVRNAIYLSEDDFTIASKLNTNYEGNDASLLIPDDFILAFKSNIIFTNRSDGLVLPDDVSLAEQRSIVFSGTVTEILETGPVGVHRKVLFYASDSILLGTTYSDANGNFSITLKCAPSEKVRVICVGAAGQNSLIKERVIPYV